MDQEEIIQKTKIFLEEKFTAESSGHDYWHMCRVWQLAKHIAKQEEGVEIFILELVALLHDIADWKSHKGDMEAGPRAAREWLESINVNDLIIQRVQERMRAIPYVGEEFDRTSFVPIESQIVHDADDLDAIGAIGIARAFMYVGAKGKPMYNPQSPIRTFKNFEEYKRGEAPAAINHFYERLLLIRDGMLTKTGSEMASRRHEVMEQFLQEFLEEWDGKQ